MTLQEALSDIKNAVYGEDVRNAILGGLELCYSERLSGGYNPNTDVNLFVNGAALFDSSATNKPFNSSFFLIAGGNEEECCQLAIDPAGVYSKMIRHKENDIWSEWASIVETLMIQVRYYSYDGSELLYTEKVSEGHNAVWNGTPERASSAQYNYIFLGWNLLPNQMEISDGALNNLTASVDVYAAYNPTPRSYNVYFYNGSTLFDMQSVVYGGNASQPASTPTKEPTPQYSYSFIGWNTNSGASEADASSLTGITTDRNVYAIYRSSVRSYTVSFRNGSTELQSITVPYDGTAIYSGATPIKESSEQYTYSFVGWSTVDGATSDETGSRQHIRSDRILYAAFSTTTVAYTVRFMNGVNVLETVSVEYDHSATYSGDTPTKDPTEQYIYSFLGWNTNPNATSANAGSMQHITSDRDVYAIYRPILRSYTVMFMNGDTLFGSTSVQYGGTASQPSGTPTKASSTQYVYTFAGWNKLPNQEASDSTALTNVTGDRTVYAAFSTSLRPYIVRFIDNGTILETKNVLYGNDVTYTGTTPKREDTAQYDYEFVGWNSSPNQTVKDDTVLQYITANRDIYAAYSMTLKSYTVRFYNGSELLETSTVAYGSTAVYSGEEPAKEASGEYIYAFNGWNSLPNQETEEAGVLDHITGDLDVYAAFSLSPRYHTVRFYNGSALLDTQSVDHGDLVTYGGSTPTKASVAQYDYTFNGWSEDDNQTKGTAGIMNRITKDMDLYAAFLPVLKTFTVRFLSGSTVLQTTQVQYGGDAVYSGSTPTKTPTAHSVYTFVGWALQDGQTQDDISARMDITAPRDIYAAFTASTRYYTVGFYNGSTLLTTAQTVYDGSVTYSGTTPSKQDSGEHPYFFEGWAFQDGQTENDPTALTHVTADRNVYAAFSVADYIFGIKRQYGVNSSEWERTNDSQGFTATATIGDTPGSSSFDTVPIYKDIKRVTLSTGDVMVQIPKFYFKRYLETENGTQYEHIQITKIQQDGFSLHPAFCHNDEEQDYIYVGAYHISEEDSTYVSKSGRTVLTNVTPSTMQTNVKSKGSGWGLYDISTHMAIEMLYLVEFANNNSQATVGVGLCKSGTIVATGACDSIAGLTGGPEPTSSTSYDVPMVWHGVENLWGMVDTICDGLHIYRTNVYVSNKQDTYIATNVNTDYELLGYTILTSGPVLKMGLDTSNPAYMFGTETTNITRGYCDTEVLGSTSAFYPFIYVGGSSNSNQNGLFHMTAIAASAATARLAGRLLYIPGEAESHETTPDWPT